MKLINTLGILLFSGVVVLSIQGCQGAKADNPVYSKIARAENQKAEEVKVYYFHATRRCATCMAVEAVTKEALQDYYGDKVTFESINVEDEKESPLLAQYKIGGQTLLIVNGDKKVDLTNDAFLNARTNPDKFKSKLKSTIDSML